MPELSDEQKELLQKLEHRKQGDEAIQRVANIAKHPPKKTNQTIAGLGIILIAILIIFVAYSLLTDDNKDPITISPTPTVDPEITIIEPTINPLARPDRVVAYITNDPAPNIFYVDAKGQNKTKITDNTDTETTIQHLKWKGRDELAFSLCSNIDLRCNISVYSISKKETTEIIPASSFIKNTTITAFSFDHSGSQLAYTQQTPDGRTFVQLRENGSQVTLKELPAGIERALTFDDMITLAFSPDDKHLMVNHTTSQPNTSQQHETLWIFVTATAQEKLGVGEPIQRASNSFWLDNNTIVYKFFNGRLIQKNITTQGETQFTDGFATRYGFKISESGDTLAFWLYPNAQDRPQLGTLNLLNNQKNVTITTENFIAPQWIQNGQVMALETRTQPGQTTFSLTGRLMLIRLNNNATLELVPNGVIDFAVEPEL